MSNPKAAAPRALYYPEYKPKDADKFAAMAKLLSTATSPSMLSQLVLLYLFDMAYDREDLLVALGRAEHACGWKALP